MIFDFLEVYPPVEEIPGDEIIDRIYETGSVTLFQWENDFPAIRYTYIEPTGESDPLKAFEQTVEVWARETESLEHADVQLESRQDVIAMVTNLYTLPEADRNNARIVYGLEKL